MATTEARFWAKVQKTDSCWIWTATVVGPGKYGQFHVSGGRTDRVRSYAHRWAYEQLVGPIPEGLELDHTCRNRRCVNPAHLEPVTHAQNHERRRGFRTGPYNVGDHCRHGHPRTPENTRINVHGARVCKPCSRASVRRSREAKKSTT